MTESVKPNLRNPVHLLAFGFGSGLIPKAPGTAGTIAAILPWLWLSQQSLTMYLTVLLATTLIGIYLCDKTSRDLGVHDHSGIVWDEFCGLWLTMIAVPATWQWLLLGFVLFRFFDIIKPWPINWLDKKIPGGLGIMVDDLLAGLFAWLILQSLLYFR
ncbi:MAG: phosphatidylglycerophosphatase A [Gammaproteobacteria bacterium]|nr:phosphatidylglycerophosphatase A [Gammaproteobacteria bacterium]